VCGGEAGPRLFHVPRGDEAGVGHEQGAAEAEAVRQLGSFAAKNLVGFVSDAAAKVPIPAVEGMTIVDAQVTTGEAAGGYLVVTGNVAVR